MTTSSPSTTSPYVLFAFSDEGLCPSVCFRGFADANAICHYILAHFADFERGFEWSRNGGVPDLDTFQRDTLNIFNDHDVDTYGFRLTRDQCAVSAMLADTRVKIRYVDAPVVPTYVKTLHMVYSFKGAGLEPVVLFRKFKDIDTVCKYISDHADEFNDEFDWEGCPAKYGGVKGILDVNNDRGDDTSGLRITADLAVINTLCAKNTAAGVVRCVDCV